MVLVMLIYLINHSFMFPNILKHLNYVMFAKKLHFLANETYLLKQKFKHDPMKFFYFFYSSKVRWVGREGVGVPTSWATRLLKTIILGSWVDRKEKFWNRTEDKQKERRSNDLGNRLRVRWYWFVWLRT